MRGERGIRAFGPVALCCPYCAGMLQPRFDGRDDFNVLACDCGSYPVLGGIPVLKRGAVGRGGESAEHLVRLLEAGRGADALLAMLTASLPDRTRLSRWSKLAARVLGGALGARHAARPGVRRAAELLARADGQMTAGEAIQLVYRHPGAGALSEHTYHHFVYRLGQPRHLVAASLATLIERPARPVLEVACGFGHISRALGHRAGDGNVVGLDQSFLALYVASRWIAPSARFVCADADDGLPFPDGSFAAAMCVDGVHYFRRKAVCVRELRRVLEPGAPMILAATRNRLVACEHAAEALPAGAYADLVAGMPHRIVGDADVLARYLARQGPDLSASAPLADLEKAEFVSIVAGGEHLFRAHGALADWPHAAGRLAVNPLYVLEARDTAGAARFRRQFPTSFYDQDNAGYRDYLPEHVTIDPAILADLEAGRRTPAMEPLIARCVLLGLPDRYLRR